MSEIPINKDVETRIIKAINHIEPDRVPIWEALESPTLYNHFAPGEKDFLKAASIACEALGIDMTYGCMNLTCPEKTGHIAKQGLE